MFCKKCGTEIPYGVEYCPNCKEKRVLQKDEYIEAKRLKLEEIKNVLSKESEHYQKKLNHLESLIKQYQEELEEEEHDHEILQEQYLELKAIEKEIVSEKEFKREGSFCPECGAGNQFGNYCTVCGRELNRRRRIE